MTITSGHTLRREIMFVTTGRPPKSPAARSRLSYVLGDGLSRAVRT